MSDELKHLIRCIRDSNATQAYVPAEHWHALMFEVWGKYPAAYGNAPMPNFICRGIPVMPA